MGRAVILVKKTFSLTLVFNALLTIAYAVGILSGFYWFYSDWQPFAPFLLNGNFFWIAIAAATLNVFPSALLGRPLKTGRFLFHHYFYGFLVLLFAAVYVIFLTPASLFTIFLVDNTSIAVNIGRFFILGGWTLVLDDLPDVHRIVESKLNWMKLKAKNGGRFLSAIQLVMGALTFYVFAAVLTSIIANPQWVTTANLILLGSLLVTGITCFVFVKRQFWQQLKVN